MGGFGFSFRSFFGKKVRESIGLLFGLNSGWRKGLELKDVSRGGPYKRGGFKG